MKKVLIMLILINSNTMMGQSKHSHKDGSSHSYSVNFTEKQYLEVKDIIEDKFAKPDLIKDDISFWVQSDEKKFLNIQLFKNKVQIKFHTQKKNLKTEKKVNSVIEKLNTIFSTKLKKGIKR